MSTYSFDDHYVNALRFAINNGASRQYVLFRLEQSLKALKIDEECCKGITQLLLKLIDPKIEGKQLGELVSTFRRNWKTHLDRVYLIDYEKTRWNFFSQYVLNQNTIRGPVGRCLDVGCGRGCITANLVHEKLVSEAVGVDAEDFSDEWRERKAVTGGALRFESVPVDQLENWLGQFGVKFDLILLFYVLHHSEEYWAARTLRALRESLRPGGRVIVLEDALDTELGGTHRPASDFPNCATQWQEWAGLGKVYCLTPAYDVQVLLDFVAVQLLAGFVQVRMPCNYRTMSDWEERFRDLSYQVVKREYIGFPRGRDIDVPQALFVLERAA